MKKRSISYRLLPFILLILCVLLVGCGGETLESLEIQGNDRITLEVGNTITLQTNAPESLCKALTWSASDPLAVVDSNGTVTARAMGKVIISVSYGDLSDSVLIEIVEKSDLLDDSEKNEFYQNYTTAQGRFDALKRSANGILSGMLEVPDQAPIISAFQPQKNGVLIRNNEPFFADENTYVVVDAYGNEVFRVYRGGGYITLEEVAAYVYAFGDVPANYVKGKNAEPENSIWGEYLRLNHTEFSGDTDRYPYEPVLPNISGCGGDLFYYEIDIGTTGTDCDDNYVAKTYNDGDSITRGAARIVYTRYDANGDKIIDPNEKYLFYTYNHYNDFQEYLNYYGGWGEMFGNITGGGTISSRVDYAPTAYIPTILASLDVNIDAEMIAWHPTLRKYWLATKPTEVAA